MTSNGKSLELFFIDGRPDGMLTAEVFNWTGHVLRIPRTQIKDGLARPETAHTGVYVLIGDRDGAPLAYIGEAENLRERLKQHVKAKDWWDTTVLISTMGDGLHKAHVKYLESRLVELAIGVGNTPLENNSTPARSSLSEAATANMESFLDTLNMVLPAIRVDMFLQKTRDTYLEANEASSKADNVFVLKTAKHGVQAHAVLVKGEVIVKAGATARAAWHGSLDSKTHYSKLYHELTVSSVLVPSGQNSIFQRDYAFSSLSAAAAILNGRSSNGRREWKHKQTGLSFADWEAAQIDELAQEGELS